MKSFLILILNISFSLSGEVSVFAPVPSTTISAAYTNGTVADLGTVSAGEQLTITVNINDPLDAHFIARLRECRLESGDGAVSIKIIENFVVPQDWNWIVEIKNPQTDQRQIQFNFYFFECMDAQLGKKLIFFFNLKSS